MKSQAMLPSQSDVWGILPLRFESELTAQKLEIWRLWGLSEEFGPVGNNSTAECAGREIIDELTGFLVCAVALDTQVRIATSARRGHRAVLDARNKTKGRSSPSRRVDTVGKLTCFPERTHARREYRVMTRIYFP